MNPKDGARIVEIDYLKRLIGKPKDEEVRLRVHGAEEGEGVDDQQESLHLHSGREGDKIRASTRTRLADTALPPPADDCVMPDHKANITVECPPMQSHNPLVRLTSKHLRSSIGGARDRCSSTH